MRVPRATRVRHGSLGPFTLLCLDVPLPAAASHPPRPRRRGRAKPRPRLPHAIAAARSRRQQSRRGGKEREGAEREPRGRRSRRVGVGYLVDGPRLGVVRVEEAKELRRADFGGVRVHEGRPLGGRGREPRGRRRERVRAPSSAVHGVHPGDAGPGVRVRVRGRGHRRAGHPMRGCRA